MRSFASKSGPRQFNLVNRKADTMQKVHPGIKKQIDQQMDDIKFVHTRADGSESLMIQPQVHATTYLKHMNSDFEVFFQKRNYSERNFASYLQVLAQQYKHKEAQQAFDKMLTLGIPPSDYCYT